MARARAEELGSAVCREWRRLVCCLRRLADRRNELPYDRFRRLRQEQYRPAGQWKTTATRANPNPGQRRTETDILQLQQKLAQAHCVSALKELHAAIAHAVNQPLSGTLISAQLAQRLLASEEPAWHEIREALSDIVAEARRAAGAIRELGRALRKRKRSVESSDLNSLIQEVILLARNDLQIRDVHLVFDPDRDLPGWKGDRIQLQQIVLNLICNAWQAAADSPRERRRILVRTRRHHERAALIEVQDSGPAVRDEDLDHLFEPFYTTKAVGLGLGLSITRSLVDDHQGRIWAERNPDHGLTFSLTLPCLSD